MIMVIFIIVHWYSCLFSHSFFLHRYSAHHAFLMNRSWEKVFFVFTWITMGSSYMSARTYAIMHRLHHEHTDTDDDPHSPHYSKSPLALMRKAIKGYMDIHKGRVIVEAKYLTNIPEWNGFESWAHSWYARGAWVAFYILFYALFASAAWQFIFIPLHIFMSPIHGAIVNWYAHKYGSTNFIMNNTSKNIKWAYLLMLGETYHNNHHKFPTRANFGTRRLEIDPFYYLIIFFQTLNILRIKKPIQEHLTIAKK
jgi:stearoyl-CoA desaturase (Delta-9 desaturase)